MTVISVEERLEQEELLSQVALNTIYRHYKGGIYHTDYIVEHTETEELMVVYHSLEDDERLMYARPVKDFLSRLTSDELSKGTVPQGHRFVEFTFA